MYTELITSNYSWINYENENSFFFSWKLKVFLFLITLKRKIPDYQWVEACHLDSILPQLPWTSEERFVETRATLTSLGVVPSTGEGFSCQPSPNETHIMNVSENILPEMHWNHL